MANLCHPSVLGKTTVAALSGKERRKLKADSVVDVLHERKPQIEMERLVSWPLDDCRAVLTESIVGIFSRGTFQSETNIYTLMI